MKKIDILLIKELFLLRYSKKYNKQVLKDFCDCLSNMLKYGVSSPKLENFLYRSINPLDSFDSWIDSYDKNMLSLSPKDFAIRRDFKNYLLKYKEYIYDEKF